ncbi:MAG: hypothetical protein IJE08_01140 [Clostridia bacterium]|nr:hypothetical protein [Clostridia bacterium]
MEKLFELARLYTRQFPAGNEPYQIVARILEECGEVAAEVNHFEKSGVKAEKMGEPKKENMAGEIKQAINALIQLAQYYEVEQELLDSIDASIERRRNALGIQ